MSWSDLFTYWQSKHVGGTPPSRANLDPISEIPKLVRNLILIDCLADGYRYRLIGSELVSRVGRDATGEGARSGPFDPALIERWIATLDLAAKGREPQLIRSRLDGGGSVLTLILPLVSPEGHTEMLLGGSFIESATEGSWRPNMMERVDLALLPGDVVDPHRSSGVDQAYPSQWTTKYPA